MTPLFTLECDALPASAEVVGFFGAEGLNRLYEFSVYLHTTAAEAETFEPDAALYARATLRAHRDDGSVRLTRHGIVRAVEHLHDLTDTALYRVELAPAAWLLTLGHHSRVWVQSTPAEAIAAALRAGSLGADEFEVRVQGAARRYEHIAQYRESDLDFVARWCEREGYTWFFTHDGATERLVVVNRPDQHPALDDDPLCFFASGGDDGSAPEAVETFTARHGARTAAVRVRDHDWTRSADPVEFTAPAHTRGHGERALWQRNVATAADARRIAAARADALTADQTVFSGAGRNLALTPGYTVALADHPLDAFNARYLLVTVHHRGSQISAAAAMHERLGFTAGRAWHLRFTAIRAATPYRHDGAPPWPRIDGLVPAVVDGPADGDYAQLDAHGRYLVRLRFDEREHAPGEASMRVRMGQPHAGEPEGMHLPLRRGTEVMVAFLGGDPDCPYVVGAVPDALHPSPVTSANATQNVIHTGANNRIEIDDDAAHPYIDLYSPPKHTALHLGEHHPHGYHGGHDHHFVLTTDGDGLVHTGATLDITVGGEKHEHVVKHVEEAYDATQTTTVGEAVTETYKANQTTSVTKHVEETYGSHRVTVQNAQVETCDSQQTTVTTMLRERHGSQQTTVTNALSETTPLFCFTVRDASRVTNGTLLWTVGPGTTTIEAGTSFDMTAPNFSLLALAQAALVTPQRQETGSKRTLLTPIELKYGVAKVALTMMSASAAAVKLEAYGINFATYLHKLDINGVSIGAAAYEGKVTAFKKINGAMKIVVTGVKTIV